MKHSNFRSACMTLMASAALAACGGNDDPRSVTLDFSAVAGAAAVNCGSPVNGLGSSSVSAQLKDLRFYISNVKFVSADGSEVPLTLSANDDWNLTAGSDTVTLIDLEDGTGSCAGGTAGMNATIKGTVPVGAYTGIKMTMGVPFALNHSDYATATKPMDVQAMAWSWQSGRKFAKIEVTDPNGATGTWTAKTFNVHLGSTGCTGNPATGATVSCAVANRMDVRLVNFNPDTQKITLDVQSLLAGTEVTVNQAGAPGCMSGGTDPECLNVFRALAIDWQANGTGSGLSISGGAGQTLFKAVSK